MDKAEFDAYIANLNAPKTTAPTEQPVKKRGRPKLVRPSTTAAPVAEPVMARADELEERRIAAADRVRTKVRLSSEGYTTALGGGCESPQYAHGKRTRLG
jgi:hypothetical protein